MKILFRFFLILVFPAISCTHYIYQPAAMQPDESAEVMYRHGTAVLRAEIDGAELFARLSSKGRRDMSVDFFLRNQGDSAFTFVPDEVHVYGFNAAGERRPFQVFTAEQYLQRERSRDLLIAGVVTAAVIATVAVAVANSDNGGDGGGNNRDDVDDDFWWWWITGPTVVVTPTPPREPEPFPDNTTRPPDGLLRRHTLYPGEALQGLVKMRAEPEYAHKILIEVPVQGQYAKLVFDKAVVR